MLAHHRHTDVRYWLSCILTSLSVDVWCMLVQILDMKFNFPLTQPEAEFKTIIDNITIHRITD